MKNSMVEELQILIEENKEHLYINKSRHINEEFIYPKMSDMLHKSRLFDAFNNKMQFIGSSGNPMDYDELTKWLIIRGKKTSPMQAIDELYNYIENDNFEVNNILWLDGVYLEKEYQIGENVFLCPENSLMNEQLSKMITGVEISKIPTIQPSAYLYERIEHPRIHRSENEEPEFFRINYDNLEPVMLLMHLIRRDGVEVQAIASSFIVDESVPHGSGFSYRYLKYQPLFRNRQIIQLEINHLTKLHDLYKELDNNLKIRVKFILKLLMIFENETELVEKAMHLRVLLESLYLNESDSDKADKLVENIVKIHGDKVIKSNKLRRIVKDVYHDCSKAIHSGQLSENGIKRCYKHFPIIRDIIKNDVIRLIVDLE